MPSMRFINKKSILISIISVAVLLLLSFVVSSWSDGVIGSGTVTRSRSLWRVSSNTLTPRSDSWGLNVTTGTFSNLTVDSLSATTLAVSSFAEAPFVISDNANTTTTISNTGTNSTIGSTGDIYITPASSAQDIMLGGTTFNGRTNFVGNTISSMNWRDSSLTVRAQMIGNYTLDQMVLSSSAGVGNQLVLATNANESYDFGHNAEDDFALYIQDSSGDNSHYLKAQYVSSTSKAVLTAGYGYLAISPTTNSEGLNFANSEVGTTDGTQTTAMTLSTLTDKVYHVTTYITAISDDETIGASYVIHGTFKNAGGVLTNVGGTTTQVHGEDGGAGLAVAYDVSGTDIRVRVTGLAATNIRWGVTSQYTALQYGS